MVQVVVVESMSILANILGCKVGCLPLTYIEILLWASFKST